MLVEAITYRFRGHSMADPEEYRTKEQVAEWRKNDPIQVFARGSRRRASSSEGEAEKIDEARSSSASTRPSPSPTRRRSRAPESLYDDIYVLGDQVKGWYSVDERSAGVHRGENERELAEEERGADRRLRRGGRAGRARGPRRTRPRRPTTAPRRPSD